MSVSLQTGPSLRLWDYVECDCGTDKECHGDTCLLFPLLQNASQLLQTFFLHCPKPACLHLASHTSIVHKNQYGIFYSKVYIYSDSFKNTGKGTRPFLQAIQHLPPRPFFILPNNINKII